MSKTKTVETMPTLFGLGDEETGGASVTLVSMPAKKAEPSPREILARDFLGRDSSFVHQRKRGRSGWETTLPPGSSFSDYIMDTSDEHALLKRAYRIARNTLAVMDLPKKVRVVVNHQEKDCTDSVNVFVSTNVFDAKELSPGQKADVFIGTAIHEGCHIKYTDFAVNGGRCKMLHSLLNVVEDERIERILGEDMPGFANYIKMMKYWAFNLYERKLDKLLAEKGTPLTRTVRLFNAILHLVRYPAALTSDDLDEFGDILVRVRDILTDWPADTEAAKDRAERIYELFREEAEKEAASQGEGEDGDEGDEGESGEGTSGKGTGKKKRKASTRKGGEGDEPGEGTVEGDENGEPGDEISEDGCDGDAGSESENSSPDGGEHAEVKLSDEQLRALEDLLDTLSQAAGSLYRESGEKPGRDDMSKAVQKDPLVQEKIEETVEKGDNNTYFVAPEAFGDQENFQSRYKDSLQRVRPYIASVRRILQDNATEFRRTERGCLNGKLDELKLVEAVQGYQAVYLQHNDVKSKRVAVCILVDESGSMCASFAGRSRSDWARDTVILLNEGLKDVPNVDLYIYGHSADASEFGILSTQIIAYRDRMKRDRWNLGAVTARCNNSDGVAIREVAKRVRQQTKEPCLMFVISDGQPASYLYSRKDGVKDTAEAVKEVTKMGFTPVQIAITSAYDPSLMFQHHLSFTDLASLPKQLARVVTKAVLKNSGRDKVK